MSIVQPVFRLGHPKKCRLVSWLAFPLRYKVMFVNLSKEELDEKLSFLIEKGFVSKNEKDNEIFYSLDVDRLSEILENDDNFKNIDDGLAKLDSFLN